MIKTTNLETSKEVKRVLEEAGILLKTPFGHDGYGSLDYDPEMAEDCGASWANPAYTLGELMEVVPWLNLAKVDAGYIAEAFGDFYLSPAFKDELAEEAVAKGVIWLGDNGYLKGGE